MGLDAKVATAVFRAHQIERALHDQGPWSITVGPLTDGWEIPARKVIGEDHVTFYAVVSLRKDQVLPGHGYIHAELHCGDRIVAIKNLPPVDGIAEISWGFQVIDPEQVTA